MSIRFDKPDAVKKDLVPYLRALGFSYRDLPQTIIGQPDGLVGIHGFDRQIEFKSGKRKLTEEQAIFMARWRGAAVWILRTRKDCDELRRSFG